MSDAVCGVMRGKAESREQIYDVSDARLDEEWYFLDNIRYRRRSDDLELGRAVGSTCSRVTSLVGCW